MARARPESEAAASSAADAASKMVAATPSAQRPQRPGGGPRSPQGSSRGIRRCRSQEHRTIGTSGLIQQAQAAIRDRNVQFPPPRRTPWFLSLCLQDKGEGGPGGAIIKSDGLSTLRASRVEVLWQDKWWTSEGGVKYEHSKYKDGGIKGTVSRGGNRNS